MAGATATSGGALPPAPSTSASVAAASLVASLPSDSDFAAYFDQLTASSPWPVSVRPSPAGGKGLFVTSPVRAGDVLLVDTPLAACPQGFGSRSGGLVCSACGRAAGGPAAQAAHAALAAGGGRGPDAPALLRIVAGLDAVPGAPGLRPTAGGGGGAWALPAPGGPTPCPGGCADELYCSPACAASDWTACHGAVCAGGDGDGGGDPERAAAGAALAHAAAHGNEALWLAARAVGGVAARATAAAAAGASPSDALEAGWRPWAVAEKALWWEQPAWPPVAAAAGGSAFASSDEPGPPASPSPPPSPAATDDDGEAAFRAGLRGLCEDAAAALAVLLRPPPPLPPGGGEGAPRPPPPPPLPLTAADLLPLATPAVVGALVGAFELNNLEVDVPGLWESLAVEEGAGDGGGGGGEAPPPPPPAKRARASGERPQPPRLAWPRLLALAGGGRPPAAWSAPSAGSAFYPLQACANHSCVPTARAVRGAGTHGLAWVVEGGGGGGGVGGGGGGGTETTTAAARRRGRRPSAGPPLPPPLSPSARPVDAVLVAAVDLRPGDEVTLCYVEEGADVETRAAGLRDYGVPRCACARCVRERVGSGEADEVAPAPGLTKGGGRASAWVGAWRV